MTSFTLNKNNHTIIIIYSIVVFILVYTMLLFSFLFYYTESVKKDISKNIYEYEEVDLSHLCGLYNCLNIKHDDKAFKNENFNQKYPRLSTCGEKVKFYSITDDVQLSSDLRIKVLIKETHYNGYIIVHRDNFISLINTRYFYILTFVITFNVMLLIINITSHRKNELKKNLMLHHEGYYKSMMLLTENIHHELNTPLSVINNKVHKLKNKIDNVISGALTKEMCDENGSAHDFEIILSALEQISDLVTRMRPFKDMKSQRTRDIKNILMNACDILLVSQHERFDYDIKPGFDDYKLDTSKMKVGELSAILLNMIKNSIDANATDIVFKINKYKTKSKCLSFYIIDNGNGIPEELQKNCFKENTSSKGSSRGNGLYINKYILNNSDGDIILSHSTLEGTVFEMIIPVKLIGEKT